MKFSAVKRQLLEDQVESAKSLLSYTAEIERNGELNFNPYFKSQMAHLQKYVDQLSVKPKSPFGVYRRTEEEDLSYCLHKNHSKSLSTITGLMKDINKELYRYKKLKQAEKKLEFLELFQSRDQDQSDELGHHVSHNSLQNSPKMNQYKLPESKSAYIPQLASPKPKYEPVSLHTEEEEKPEMSRAMESFLKQQEKERKEKELKQQKEIKPIAAFLPNLSSSDMREEKESDRTDQQQANNSVMTPNTVISKENALISSDESKVDSVKEKKNTDSSSQRNRPLSFSGLRSSSPTYHAPHSHPFTSSDPERPYGAYSNENAYPHYLSALGRSSGTTTLEQTKSAEDKEKEKSRTAAFY